MDTDRTGKENQMDRCKHDMVAAYCGDCAQPVRPAVEFDRQPQATDWTLADERFALEAREAGISAADTGEMLGRTKLAVSAKLAELDGRNAVSKANEEARKEAARAAASQAREPWSSNEDSFLVEQIAQGATHQSIAAVLNRSMDAVAARIYKLRRLGEVA